MKMPTDFLVNTVCDCAKTMSTGKKTIPLIVSSILGELWNLYSPHKSVLGAIEDYFFRTA